MLKNGGEERKKKREEKRDVAARVFVTIDRGTEERRRAVSIGIFIIYIYLYSSLISANLETGGEKEAFREYLARVLRFTLYLLKRNNEKKEERERKTESIYRGSRELIVIDEERETCTCDRSKDPFVPMEQIYITNTRSRSRRL